MYDLIIIGAGPAGMYAAHLANLHNINSIVLEASTDHGGQMNLFLDKPVYDLPGFLKISGKKLKENIFKQYQKNSKTKIFYQENVFSIEGTLDNFIVKSSKNTYKCKTVIISTGGGLFEPVKLGIKNEIKYQNIHYSVKKSEKFEGKNLVIFGGGDSAIDWAHYFHKKKSNITLIHRREKFRGQEHLIDEINEKIEILKPYKIFGVTGGENISEIQLINIKTKQILKKKCDEIMVFFGQKKISLRENPFKLEKNKEGYVVKTSMETSRKGVFAIGNDANYLGKVKTMITGFGEAAIAVGSVLEVVRPGKKMSYYVKKKEL